MDQTFALLLLHHLPTIGLHKISASALAQIVVGADGYTNAHIT